MSVLMIGSRILRRVPMDFDWPLGEAWKGFLNLHYDGNNVKCPFCDGCGLNEKTAQIEKDWYDFEETGRKWHDKITQDEVDALAKAGRLRDYTHEFVDDDYKKKDPAPEITAEEINEAYRGGMGHDAINRGICVEARAKRLGVYGECECCHGEGDLWRSKEHEKKAEEWESSDPPEGKGFQLWETVSEGSPISPVFDKLEALCEWLGDNNKGFAQEGFTKERWFKIFKDSNDPFVVQDVHTGEVHKDGKII